MTFSTLPLTSEAFAKLSWSQIEPWYHELLATELTSVTLDAWMVQWSQLSALVDETFVQHEIATTTNTADESRVQRKQQFMETVYVLVQDGDQQINGDLLTSGLTPEGF